MTLQVTIALLFMCSLSLSTTHAGTYNPPLSKAAEMFGTTLQRSLEYNQTLLDTLRCIRDRKSAKQAIARLVDLRRTFEREIRTSKECVDYLNAAHLSTSHRPFYFAMMSQYRLGALEQVGVITREKERLDRHDWYGLQEEIKHHSGYLAYIYHRFKNKELKHRDTKARIEEYRQKIDATATELLALLSRISNPITAKRYTSRLPSLVDRLREDNNIINLYLYDDWLGGQPLLPDLLSRFEAINTDLLSQVERIRKENDDGDAALRRWVISLKFPLLQIRAPIALEREEVNVNADKAYKDGKTMTNDLEDKDG